MTVRENTKSAALGAVSAGIAIGGMVIPAAAAAALGATPLMAAYMGGVGVALAINETYNKIEPKAVKKIAYYSSAAATIGALSVAFAAVTGRAPYETKDPVADTLQTACDKERIPQVLEKKDRTFFITCLKK